MTSSVGVSTTIGFIRFREPRWDMHALANAWVIELSNQSRYGRSEALAGMENDHHAARSNRLGVGCAGGPDV
ncbi:MAG: hypothetical protein HWE26_17175 [Alteromonadaceae bacterium]|nr:hypothetical protein [Alteromonadaceae bacterium]